MRVLPKLDVEEPASRAAHDEANGQPAASRRTHRGNGWSRRSRILLLALIIALLTDFFLGLFLGLYAVSLNQENDALSYALRQAEQELARIKPELAQLQADRQALLEGRFPRLVEMEYDKVIELNQDYVKNVVFNLLNDRFEYKLILQNNSLYRVWPEVKIHFFNEIGIQVSSVEIGVNAERTAGESTSLGPDEVRSYPGSIKLAGDDQPVYFMVVVRNEEDADAAAVESIE